ncbi:MAG: hypothetical protein HY366_00210 [Candidatus Aenigmarchaeota archaeon]|nr:hypothetical protein [Candidatus Aenigmarchaeota archaeon]
MIKRLLKGWRFWLFAIVFMMSVLSIGYSPGKAGVVVSSVDASSPLAPFLQAGEPLYAINEVPVKTPGDVERWKDYTGVMRVVHKNGLNLVNIEKPGLGIEVSPAPSTKLSLGMDLIGGTRVLLQPQYAEGTTQEEQSAMADQIITTLQTRTNVYGLRELPIRQVRDVSGTTYVQIETAGATLADIENLLHKQGKFEGFIPREVVWLNDTSTGIINVNGKKFSIRKVSNTSIEFGGSTFTNNETLDIGNLTFEVRNVTAISATLAAHVFDSSDIKFVHTSSANSYVLQSGGGWEFVFGIITSDFGAQKFAAATADLDEIRTPGSSDCYLSEKIELYLDRILVSDLNIACSLRGEVVNSVQITGGSSTEEGARQEMRQLQTVLKSGSLPVPLETVRVDTVSPTLGRAFLSSVTVAGLVAFVGVVSIVYLRYRRLDIVMPMLFIALSEIIIILGVAAAIRWTIDLSAIAGIIASIGTGVNDQIVVADEALSKERYNTKERIRRAFFIVFGAAATIIAAMVPLAFIGIGVMRGFAVTTIIGVLVGILVTRPLYGKIVEIMVKE